jgi:hypothetical protein
MKEKIKLFWGIYDKYISTGDTSLRSELSKLLGQIEKKSRQDQLLRPEKGWNEILAWQVLRNQSFVFSKFPLWISEGEIVIWLPHWNRDVFITRFPKEEVGSGSFLKPGFHLTHDDKGDRSDYEWDDIILRNGITDERGLYLPLYNSNIILKICDYYIAERKKLMLDYLRKEKGWVSK